MRFLSAQCARKAARPVQGRRLAVEQSLLKDPDDSPRIMCYRASVPDSPPNADHFFHIGDKDLAVAIWPVRAALTMWRSLVFPDRQRPRLRFSPWAKIDRYIPHHGIVLCDLSAAKATDFGHRHALDPDRGQRVFDFFQFEVPDHGFDAFSSLVPQLQRQGSETFSLRRHSTTRQPFALQRVRPLLHRPHTHDIFNPGDKMRPSPTCRYGPQSSPSASLADIVRRKPPTRVFMRGVKSTAYT